MKDLFRKKTQYKIIKVDGNEMKTECQTCGFQKVFIDNHTSQYKYCPQCGRKIVYE